ncbi:MAG: radical SAM family heme chaperone HemW [Bacteroidaceae bacterium]|nr:radical SAM family heme chaperone HemW [Bacteroidaceae bacterium]
MAGIYLHIPFCKSRCIYCGFFSTTSLQKRHDYVDAVVEELRQRRSFLANQPIDTIYFGGGTPSQLPSDELERMLDAIYHLYNVREGAEVTLEGNPDDLTPSFLQRIRQMGVNRLSMGVQSFDDARLRFLHRRHTAAQAIQAVRDVQAAGFTNLSIDLMFGFPGQTLDQWKQDVQTALSLQVQHLSAYSLMYEEGTLLERMLSAGEITEVDEEVSLQMYEYLMDALEAAGYEHYELSNFALPGRQSRHNSSYWHGIPYLGVGAGAHSYDGYDRFYHPDALEPYMADVLSLEVEHLSTHERYDEFVFTALRTSEGLSLSALEKQFGVAAKEYCLQNAQRHLKAGLLSHTGDILCLTRHGLFISNEVMSDLMWDE